MTWPEGYGAAADHHIVRARNPCMQTFDQAKLFLGQNETPEIDISKRFEETDR